jgi:hypothetical protein
MYEGSMVGAGLNVYGVWNYVITKTKHGVVELNPKLLAVILGAKEAEIVDGIEKLCRPDPLSRCKDEEGKKLIKEGQFQYRVVSWEYYSKIKSGQHLREYNRLKKQESRSRNKENESSDESGQLGPNGELPGTF